MLGGNAGRLLGIETGYAVAAGLLAHLLQDAVEPAGVPLLAPLDANPYMHVPAWALGRATLFFTGLSAWMGRRAIHAYAWREPGAAIARPGRVTGGYRA